LFIALLLAQGGIVHAQEQASPASSPPIRKASLQERFNTASAAWEKGDCATALPLFADLAADPRFKPGSLPASAIAMRRGLCLMKTGHEDEGEPMIASALPGVRAGGAGFDVDVGMAEYQLGEQAMNRWDHDTALTHLRAALAVQNQGDRLKTLAVLAQLTAFDGGHEGLDAVGEALRLLQTPGATPNREVLAQWHALHARILLNQGDVKGGRAELKVALALSGGAEKDNIDLAGALLRADLAQAAMLDHDKDEAYKFMALSGAGRIDKSPFARARVMEPPSCGPDTGLTIEDSAVVEFTIMPNGLVGSAQPVYSSGNYAKASAFARAVSTWAWTPEDAAAIPAFFRAASRIELRCTNADGNGGGASPITPLHTRFVAWAGGVASSYLPGHVLNDGKPLTWPALVSAAQAAQSRKDDAGELAVRTLLAPVDLRDFTQQRASIERARVLAMAADRPQAVRNAALVLLAVEEPPRQGEKVLPRGASVLALADDPQVAGDALAQDTALLVAARLGAKGDALQRVADDARLGDHHPLRQFAQLRLANEAARKGDLTQAQTLFKATGLSDEQCALIGPRPAMTSNGASSTDFPTDALHWGFEGWVRTEFDIQADGHTIGARAVVSYPPFIFANAAQRILKTARYQSSFRPNGGAACSANNEMVKFTIPNNMSTVSVKAKKKT
jgi:hypothetical protein